ARRGRHGAVRGHRLRRRAGGARGRLVKRRRTGLRRPFSKSCCECYLGQLSRLVSPCPGGPVCVPLGLTPSVFLGPQPGLYWLLDALPPVPPPLLAAITPPVPAAIKARVSSVAMLRDFTWNPFVREV